MVKLQKLKKTLTRGIHMKTRMSLRLPKIRRRYDLECINRILQTLLPHLYKLQTYLTSPPKSFNSDNKNR